MMKFSNFCKVSALAVGLAVMAAPMSAHAIGTSDMVDKVLGFIAKKGSGQMCKKGSFFKKVYSLRSFEGALCGVSEGTAGFAIATCLESNTDSFDQSGCFKKAKSKLGLSNETDKSVILTAAKAAMAAEISKAGSVAKQLACTKASSLPGPAQAIALAKCA